MYVRIRREFHDFQNFHSRLSKSVAFSKLMGMEMIEKERNEEASVLGLDCFIHE